MPSCLVGRCARVCVDGSAPCAEAKTQLVSLDTVGKAVVWDMSVERKTVCCSGPTDECSRGIDEEKDKWTKAIGS